MLTPFPASMIRARGARVCFPPATSSSPLLTKRLLRVLASLGFPCLGECSHASLKNKKNKKNPFALNSQSHCTDSQSSLRPPPYLLTPLSPPTPTPSCLLWFGWLKNCNPDALCAHTSVLCCCDGIPQVASVLLQQVSAENTLQFGWSPTPYRPHCL